MCLIGAITWIRGALIVISQVAGAIASGEFYRAFILLYGSSSDDMHFGVTFL